jgi:malate dehydrogenase
LAFILIITSYAGALFAEACLKGLEGAKGVVECAYVESKVIKGISFFSSKASIPFLINLNNF